MARKLSLIAAAVAVIAFAAPPIASATTLTVGGKQAQKGTYISAVSTNVHWIWPFGEMACQEVRLDGKVQLNESVGPSKEGTVSIDANESSTSTCFIIPQYEEIRIENMALTDFRSSGNEGTGTASLEYDATYPGELKCHYSGDLPVTFQDGSNEIHLEGIGLVGAPGICGEEGEISMSADFTLSSYGGAVALNYE